MTWEIPHVYSRFTFHFDPRKINLTTKRYRSPIKNNNSKKKKQINNDNDREKCKETGKFPLPHQFFEITRTFCSFILYFGFSKGKSVNITWTVKDYGMGVTAHDSWYDKVCLSQDDKQGWYLSEDIYNIQLK